MVCICLQVVGFSSSPALHCWNRDSIGLYGGHGVTKPLATMIGHWHCYASCFIVRQSVSTLSSALHTATRLTRRQALSRVLFRAKKGQDKRLVVARVTLGGRAGVPSLLVDSSNEKRVGDVVWQTGGGTLNSLSLQQFPHRSQLAKRNLCSSSWRSQAPRPTEGMGCTGGLKREREEEDEQQQQRGAPRAR